MEMKGSKSRFVLVLGAVFVGFLLKQQLES